MENKKQIVCIAEDTLNVLCSLLLSRSSQWKVVVVGAMVILQQVV